MLSLLAKILFGEPWRRTKIVNVEFAPGKRYTPIEIKIRKPMSVITRSVGARRSLRRQKRFINSHWEIPVPPAVRWDPNKGDFGKWVLR